MTDSSRHAAFNSWAAMALQSAPAQPGRRPIRLATDCSGLGAPELAWNILSTTGGVQPAQHIFACDIAPASRQWLERHAKPRYLFADLSARVFGRSYIAARTVAGEVIKLTRSDALVDLYVAGFMCTPFSDKGKRGGWQDTVT